MLFILKLYYYYIIIISVGETQKRSTHCHDLKSMSSKDLHIWSCHFHLCSTFSNAHAHTHTLVLRPNPRWGWMEVNSVSLITVSLHWLRVSTGSPVHTPTHTLNSWRAEQDMSTLSRGQERHTHTTSLSGRGRQTTLQSATRAFWLTIIIYKPLGHRVQFPRYSLTCNSLTFKSLLLSLPC